MRKIFLSTLAAAAILAGCERHAASQTVPGYQEKQAKAQAIAEMEARTPLPINPDPPKFFPPQNQR
jgi:hypothetical protein